MRQRFRSGASTFSIMWVQVLEQIWNPDVVGDGGPPIRAERTSWGAEL